MIQADEQREPHRNELEDQSAIDPNAKAGVPWVIRTGQSLLFPDVTPEQLTADVYKPEEQVRIAATLGVRSWICVPLTLHGQTIGAISMMTAKSGRRLSQPDLALAEELGRRAAFAVENARLYREAQDAIRAREQFLSIASHELKTPLTSIKASAQILDRRFREVQIDRERVGKLTGQLTGEIGRLETLVSDLLDASRIQQDRLDLRPESFDLVALAREVVERFENSPERLGIHRLVVEGDEPVEGVWDPGRLDQVITNLISNALKYSPDGGEVRVIVRHTPAVDDLPRGAELIVRDEGIGIAAEMRERLFEPFMRADEARMSAGGTGLGLFIAAQIVDRHGGAITVESEPGTGSAFIVRLPLSMPPSQAQS